MDHPERRTVVLHDHDRSPTGPAPSARESLRLTGASVLALVLVVGVGLTGAQLTSSFLTDPARSALEGLWLEPAVAATLAEPTEDEDEDHPTATESEGNDTPT